MIEKTLLYRALSRLIALLCAVILFASCGKSGKGDAPISDGITSTPVSTTESGAPTTSEPSVTEPITSDALLADKTWIVAGGGEENGVMCAESDELIVTYAFSSTARGMAGGAVTVANRCGKRRSVSLWWGNAEGRLSGYSSLGESMIGGEFERTFDLHDMTVIPPTADRLLVVTEQEVVILPLAEERLLAGSLQYTFGCGSDIHMKGQKLWSAANFLKAYDIKVFASAGDLTQSSTETASESDREFSEITYTISLAFGDIPFYSTKGNHDLWVTDTLWAEAFDTDSPLYYAKEIEGDLFVFIGMEGVTDPFVDGALDWLEELLSCHTDKRIYIFQHLFLIDTVSSLRSSEGELLYPETILMPTSDPEEIRFRALVNAHPNVVHFSGHSHWEYRLQQYDENANIYRESETSGTMVHIGSLGRPLTSNGTSTRQEMHAEASEGMLVEVYEDYLIIKGINFETGEFVSYACYLVALGS